MCLGEYGTVVDLIDTGRAVVACRDRDRVVSTAVLVAEGVAVAPGDTVMVSMGMALRVVDGLDALGTEQEVDR
jgi:hydrogenase maturation factor